MLHRTSILAAAILVSTVAAGCGPEATGAPVVPVGSAAPLAPGSAAPAAGARATAPDFTLQATDGRTVRLSDYFGKSVVLIDFWSTTCDPCMAEMPHLVDLYKAKKDKGFVVLAVSIDGPESLADVNRVVHGQEMIFPVLLDQDTTVIARYYPKRELPFWVLIGRDGSILKSKPGYTPGDEKILAEEVDKALK